MMNIKTLKSVSYALILSLGLTFALTSCGSNSEPMDLPPAESLTIDLSLFPTHATKSAELYAYNWAYAYGTIWWYNAHAFAAVLVPTVAYKEAFNHEPTYIEDGTWQWAYSVTVFGNSYGVVLTGTRIDRSTFSMEMKLSMMGGFQDFTWFSGVIRYDLSEVNWTLYKSPDNPTEFLSIEFVKDYETEVGNIKVTIVDPDNDFYGSYIQYGEDPEQEYSAYYNVLKQDSTVNIEWSMTDLYGHVKSSEWFKDNEWHCWSETLQDVDCTVE